MSDSPVFIIIGFTSFDRSSDYCPMIDGYREAAPQDVTVIRLPRTALFNTVGHEVAEAVFAATNAPFEVEGLTAAVREALQVRISKGARVRSLSVGDTVTILRPGPVTIGGPRVERFACADCGFARLEV